MRSWLLVLGGMIAWAVHFFALYAIGETVGRSSIGRIAVLGSTLLCLVATAWIVRTSLRLPAQDEFDNWRRFVALAGAGISTLAILWQMLPALL